MGSDALMTMFGQNTRELGWFVKAGLTPAEALATATVNGAALLGMEDHLGRLAPGYLADIVGIRGDPLVDVEALFNGVVWVMKDGQIVIDSTGRLGGDDDPFGGRSSRRGQIFVRVSGRLGRRVGRDQRRGFDLLEAGTDEL